MVRGCLNRGLRCFLRRKLVDEEEMVFVVVERNGLLAK